MAQIRKGTVRLVNASTTVRHVWTGIFLSVAGGPFVNGEGLTWPGGGVGTAMRYAGGSLTLTFVRTAGPVPAVGTVLTGAGGAVATINTMGANDPPNFDVLIPTDDTVILAVPGSAAPYFLTGAAPGADSFALSAPWAGDSIDEASYGLQTAFTASGLPVIESGDVGAALIVSYGFAKLQANLERYVHLGGIDTPANVPVATATITWDAAWDPDAWLQGGADELLVPAGVSLIEVTAQFAMTGSAGDTYNFELRNNGVAITPNEVSVAGEIQTAATESVHFVSGPVPVSMGDLISIITWGTGTPSIYKNSSWMKVRVLA
jgi:hypothetical protein